MDDTTFYSCGNSSEAIFSRLEQGATLVIKTFEKDYTILNKEKYQLLMYDHSYKSVWAKKGFTKMLGSQKLLSTLISMFLTCVRK